ncbi:GntR family transcriptional regulator [bacterium]|nr:GntR family transcriptional regulator [bacterium]
MKGSKKQLGKRDEAVRLMLELLQSEKYKPGVRIPPESELVKLFGCCRSTVREAISLLVNDGRLYRIRGSGTYIAPYKKRQITIAGILPDLCNERYGRFGLDIMPPIVTGMVAEARKHGVNILLYGCGSDDKDIERENIRNAIERGVDGAVILYIGAKYNLDCLEEFDKADIPLVLVDRYVENFDSDYVVTDNYSGIYDAVNAISQMGVENIYYVTTSASVSSAKDRMLGYTTAINSLGLPCNIMISHIDKIVSELIMSGTVDRESSEYICFRKTIEGMRLPAALLSVNPMSNAFVYEVLEDLKIPSDQVILGHFDSNQPTRIVDRCYFEVDQPFTEMGKRAIQIVMSRMEGAKERQKVVLKPKLTIHNLSCFTAGVNSNVEALSVNP